MPKAPANHNLSNQGNRKTASVSKASHLSRRGTSKTSDISPGAWASVLASLGLIAVILTLDGISRFAMVEKISRTSFSEVAPHALPVATGTREEWLVLPHYAMDARWWVLHTERLLQKGCWRTRETNLDNAPNGREVHWSSLLVWILAGLSWIQAWHTGMPPQTLVAEAAMIAGPVMLIAFIGSLAMLAARRFGIFPACFFVAVLLTSSPLVRTFLTGEADHHGIVVAFAMAGALCVLAGGCGRVQRSEEKEAWQDRPTLPIAKRAFIVGGIFGAASLWISAATAIPILAGTALGGLLVAFLVPRTEKPALCPELWTIWGLAGGGTSLAFYLLEYFPNHFGWRLEVNHPLYAAAWTGGAFLLNKAVSWIATGSLGLRSVRDFALAAIAVVSVSAPLLAILCFSESVFWVADNFLLSLHERYIMEFQSLFTISRASGAGISWLLPYMWPTLILIGAAVLAISGRIGPAARYGLPLLAPSILITQALTIGQVRWGSAAFGMWSLAVLVIIADLTRFERADAPRKWVFRGLLAGTWLAILLCLLPVVVARAEEERTCMDTPIPQDLAGNLLLRDIAHRLIQSSPQKIPVVLTGPNASTEMAYHAGLHTVGTLYWENMPGLKAAARIFSAGDESTALSELLKAGVTHIVVPSWDNFSESYASLLAASKGEKSGHAPFFKTIVEGDECPDWLRPFAYPIPTNSGLDANTVKIFAVLPQQSPFESRLYRGIYFFETGHLDKARNLFEEAAALRPQDERPREYLIQLETSGGKGRH